MPDRPSPAPHDEASAETPRGELSIRTVAMPADANPAGDIFGGWLLSQMDVAGGIIAHRIALGRTATVAVDAMKFHMPVFVGDILCCYAAVSRIGRTSIAVRVEAWAERRNSTVRVKVTEGTFTYVAIDEHRRPRAVPRPAP
jgi:acyl-CoA thioesterase YciA